MVDIDHPLRGTTSLREKVDLRCFEVRDQLLELLGLVTMQRGQPRYVVSLARASSLRKRADWSRRLPRPIVIPNVMTLKTLADVRALIERHLPAGHRENRTWRHVAAELGKGCGRRRPGGGCARRPRIALSLEGVECRPK